MTAILEAKNISLGYKVRKAAFRYETVSALDSVSFKLQRGEVLGIIGRNGCGKSSLLRILAGIIDPSSGSITLPSGAKRALLSLGLGFNPELTGYNNSLLSLLYQGHSEKKAKKLIPLVKEFSELGDAFERPLKTYSSGMRARLGFASSLYAEVDILLIDETLGVGDIQFREKAESALNEKMSGKQSVVFVSHNGAQLKKICDSAILLEAGRLVAHGPVNEILKKYDGLPP